MQEAKNNILFPIETINREVDFRLILAVMCLKPGRRVYIGEMNRINRLIPQLKGGVYVGKHIFYRPPQAPDVLRFYDALKRNAFSLVYLQEEGAIYPGREPEWERSLDWITEHSLAFCGPDDLICNWGQFQSDYYARKLPRLSGCMRTTGHPRFDLYKPKYRSYYSSEIKDIQERFGQYVLINTNLTLANNSLGHHRTFSNAYGYKADVWESRRVMVRSWAHSVRVMAGMVSLVHRLAHEYPEVSFILRPHPSEDLDYYRIVFNGIKNIHVIHEGPVGPWIMGAGALIHDGCTTAVEAHIAEIPIINYKSVEEPEFDLVIPNEFGLRCTEETEVIRALSAVKSRQFPDDRSEASDRAQKMLLNFEAESLPRLLSVIEEALAVVGVPRQRDSNFDILRREFMGYLREAPRELLRPLSSKRRAHAAMKQKFYGFDSATITRKLESAQQLVGNKVKVQLLSKKMLVLEAS